MKHIFILILISLLSLQSFSQTDELAKPKSWNLSGYLKYMQTLSGNSLKGDWSTDNLLHNRLKFDWNINPNLTFKTHIRNRVFYGETVKSFPQYSDIIDNELGYMDLSGILFEGKSAFMHSTIDRLYFDYNYKKIQITIGKQRINWGQTFAWNPNDLFNSASFFDFDYEEKPGSDAVRIQYYPSYDSKLDLVAKIDHLERKTFAGLYRFNAQNTDIQILAAYYADTDYVLGAGFSGSLFKGGLRGEFSYFQPKEDFKASERKLVASMSYDYTFENSLMIQIGALYNEYGKEEGKFELSDFYFMEASPQQLSLTRWSYMANLSYPITPLLNFRFSAMYNPNDDSVYLGPSADYSLKENLDLSIYTQYFASVESGTPSGSGGFLYWRLKWSF